MSNSHFKCIFCNYFTAVRKCINIHHIVPKELGGNDNQYNLVQLCPNHHSKVYIPETKSGIHSIPEFDSIIIIGWRFSTSGYLLEYKYYNDDEIRYVEKK